MKQHGNVILGVTNNDGAGAAVIIDGKVVSAISQERIDRVKGSDAFPQEAIEYALNVAGKTMNSIDYVTYGWSNGTETLPDYSYLYSNRLSEATKTECDIILTRISTEARNNQLRRDEFFSWAAKNYLIDKTKFIDHHVSHALGSFACSPFDEALTISADGRTKHLHSLSTIDSWGFLYARITKLLGFKPNQHEGKITGLAGHGNAKKAMSLLNLMADPDNLYYPMKLGKFYVPNHKEYSEELESKVQEYFKPEKYGNLMQGQDVAAAVQYFLERYMSNLVKKLIAENGVNNICLSGGIFANVKLNNIIANIAGVQNCFVLPCMGDEGQAVASAATCYYQNTGQKISMPSMKLGEELDDSNIDLRVKAFDPDIKIVEFKDKISLTNFMVEQLQGETAKVIGIMRGRSEFGQRALCSNSILFSPRREETKNSQTVNDRLGRTEFMPFAPIVAEELAHLCFDNWSKEQPNARYMTQVYSCKEVFAENSPAVIHIDLTARPQVVSQNHDPFINNLLNAWYQSTGCLSLVNTSFNNHGEPIVERLEDGLQNMKDDRVDMIIVNDRYVITF